MSLMSDLGSAIKAKLDTKANINNPVFTGTVTLPSTTQIGNLSNTTISYLDNVTSNIQNQIDSKQDELVNSVNIMSINGISLLNAGNLDLSTMNISGNADTSTNSTLLNGSTDSTVTLPNTIVKRNNNGDIEVNSIKTFTQNSTSESSHYFVQNDSDGVLKSKTLSDVKLEIGTSLTLSGISSAPTAIVNDNSTQIANTEFVNNQINEELNNLNLLRADKYLASKDVVFMSYDINNKLEKVQYNVNLDVDYELLTYNTDGKLINVSHYINSVLIGNTVLTYSGGKLISATYTSI